MKKSTKILLISAVLLIALGAVLTVSGLALGAKPSEAVNQGLFNTEIAGGTVGISYEERGEFDDHDFDFQWENEVSPQGRYLIPAKGIEYMQLDWVAGGIELKSHSGSEIILQEQGPAEFNSENSLVYSENKGALSVRFCDLPENADRSNLEEKSLLVLLPEDMDLEELKINSVKDDIIIRGLEPDKLTVSTADGSLQLFDTEAEELKFDSINGSLYAEGSEIDSLSAETVSGGADLKLSDCPEKINLSSVSGGVKLSLPSDSEFSLKLSTVSGKLGGSFGLTGGSGSYKIGGGDESFTINTLSGNIEINRH